MPGTDLRLEELNTYTGACPAPKDFAKHWKQVKEQIGALASSVSMDKLEMETEELEYYIITVKTWDGCLLKAKYICPSKSGLHPTVIQFHDYPQSSRSWLHLSRYGAIGYAVLAPDCRGQGGMSECGEAGKGPTACGPLFHGLDGEVEDLYLHRHYEDALLWTEVAKGLKKTDGVHMAVYGEGQGGALAIACAALYPEVEKCASQYPMLCDYKRIWEKDFSEGPYMGLFYYFKWQDPMHEKEQEIFDKLAYVDAKNFAPLLRNKVLIGIGLQDVNTPPSSQFALANGIACDNRCCVYPNHGHELNNFFENEHLNFLIDQQAAFSVRSVLGLEQSDVSA